MTQVESRSHIKEPPFLLIPDAVMIVEMEGVEKDIPWFSDQLQNRAITAVCDFLNQGNERFFSAVEAANMKHFLRPRPLPSTSRDAVVQMRGWLELWIEFYTKLKDEANVKRVREIQAPLFCRPQRPSTSSLPQGREVLELARCKPEEQGHPVSKESNEFVLLRCGPAPQTHQGIPHDESENSMPSHTIIPCVDRSLELFPEQAVNMQSQQYNRRKKIPSQARMNDNDGAVLKSSGRSYSSLNQAAVPDLTGKRTKDLSPQPQLRISGRKRGLKANDELADKKIKHVTPLLPHSRAADDVHGKEQSLASLQSLEVPRSTQKFMDTDRQQWIKKIVESAVQKAKESKDLSLGRALKGIYERSLQDPTTAELLDAVVSQSANQVQINQFQAMVKCLKEGSQRSGQIG